MPRKRAGFTKKSMDRKRATPAKKLALLKRAITLKNPRRTSVPYQLNSSTPPTYPAAP